MSEENDREEVVEGVGDPAKEKTLAEPPDAVAENGDEEEEEEQDESGNQTTHSA